MLSARHKKDLPAVCVCVRACVCACVTAHVCVCDGYPALRPPDGGQLIRADGYSGHSLQGRRVSVHGERARENAR